MAKTALFTLDCVTCYGKDFYVLGREQISLGDDNQDSMFPSWQNAEWDQISWLGQTCLKLIKRSLKLTTEQGRLKGVPFLPMAGLSLTVKKELKTS